MTAFCNDIGGAELPASWRRAHEAVAL